MAYTNLNGKTISVGELLREMNEITNKGKDGKVYVPIFQRNYVWTRQYTEDFVKDLVQAYHSDKPKSISIFTLYVSPKKNDIQIVDGQQRMTSLLLMFTALERQERYVRLQFERDFLLKEAESRSSFIDKLPKMTSYAALLKPPALTDKRRLLYNYLGIKEQLESILKLSEQDKFIDFIYKKVSLLLHVTTDEPVSEFLNLNSHKIKFRICDMIRSRLMIHLSLTPLYTSISDALEIPFEEQYKEKISALFEDIAVLLYQSPSEENEIYDIVSRGYTDPESFKENRLNILFGSNEYGYEKGSYEHYDEAKLKEKELSIIRRLVFYRRMLTEIKGGIDKNYYQTINAFLCLHQLEKTKFFSLLDENEIETELKEEPEVLARILDHKFSLDRMLFKKITQRNLKESEDAYNLKGKELFMINQYFESQLVNFESYKGQESELLYYWENQDKKDKLWKNVYIPVQYNAVADLIHCSGKYIAQRYVEAREKELKDLVAQEIELEAIEE